MSHACNRCCVSLHLISPPPLGVTVDTDVHQPMHMVYFLVLQLKGVQTRSLSCSLAEDPHNIAAYACFLVARKVVNTTLSKHVTALRKLVAWRCSLTPRSAILQAALRWVNTFQAQCHNIGLPSKAALKRTNLPHAKEVMALQIKVEALADRLMAQDIQRYGKLFRRDTAIACLNAARLAMMAGYLPPLRLTAVRTLCHPDHVKQSGGCMDEECRCGSVYDTWHML